MRGPTSDPRPALDEQMLADWAAVGLRRLEAHLALHAAFCEFLRQQSHDVDTCEERCHRGHAS
jgi:hypothetical protein